MRFGEILRRANRYNPCGGDCKMTPIVVGFDVFKVHSVGNTLNLIQRTQIVAYGWIGGNLLSVSFKMAKVHSIKSYQGRK